MRFIRRGTPSLADLSIYRAARKNDKETKSQLLQTTAGDQLEMNIQRFAFIETIPSTMNYRTQSHEYL